MILNLETEKAVDGTKRLGIVSGYSQFRTTLGVLGVICDLAFQMLHSLYTWRHRGMDKHRNGKIALGELCRDHCQMLTNGLLEKLAEQLCSNTRRQKHTGRGGEEIS